LHVILLISRIKMRGIETRQLASVIKLGNYSENLVLKCHFQQL
jgi:hypothetical protein